MTYWHVGQKVVCVASLTAPYGVGIEKGTIYTIRAIFTNSNWSDDALGFALAEVMCLPRAIGEDCWHEKHFRPLRKTSIECFTSILDSPEVRDAKRVKEDAKVGDGERNG